MDRKVSRIWMPLVSRMLDASFPFLRLIDTFSPIYLNPPGLVRNFLLPGNSVFPETPFSRHEFLLISGRKTTLPENRRTRPLRLTMFFNNPAMYAHLGSNGFSTGLRSVCWLLFRWNFKIERYACWYGRLDICSTCRLGPRRSESLQR